MAFAKPPLYLSRLLPDPVMTAIRERFTLVQEPLEAAPQPAALRSGLSQSVGAIVTLTDRVDADVVLLRLGLWCRGLGHGMSS